MWLKKGKGRRLLNLNQIVEFKIESYVEKYYSKETEHYEDNTRYKLVAYTPIYPVDLWDYPNLTEANEALDRLCANNFIDYKSIEEVLTDPSDFKLELKTELYFKNRKFLVYTYTRPKYSFISKEEVDKPYKTAVYKFELSGKIDFFELYYCYYQDVESAKNGHNDVCIHLEELIGNNF